MILKISDRFKNRQISYFRDVQIDQKYDAFASTFQLSYYFDPNNREHKEFSCVSHYHICRLYHDNGELILTGYILSIEFDDSSVKNLVRISGYSLPGVLEDCDIAPTIPPKFQGSSFKNLLLAEAEFNKVNPDSRFEARQNYTPPPPYSLQSYGLSLKDIAINLLKPYGIKIVIDPSVEQEMNDAYSETEAKETQSIKSYLSELASQKNIIITHNEYGNLVFKRPRKQKPRFFIDPQNKSEIGLIKMKLAFNGQGIHSQITVVNQADSFEGTPSVQEPIFNPYCRTVFRPKVMKMTQRSENTLDPVLAARNARSKELMNLQLSFEMDRIVLDEKVLRVGDVVSIHNPNVYLYNKSDWFIHSIGFRSDPEKESCIVSCCLPEAINGDDPVDVFRGINLHPIDEA